MKKFIFAVAILFSTITFSQDQKTELELIGNDETFGKFSDSNAYSYKDQDGKSYIIFIYSEPKNEFKIIGNVKTSFFETKDFGNQIFNIVKQTSKDYPTADAIIIKPHKVKYEAVVIEFIR
jgi:hypothetical protein